MLVTGASGFIGQHLTHALIRKGARVHGCSRQWRAATTEVTDWHKVDLENLTETQDLFRSVRPRFVFHLSSLATASYDMSLVVPTLRAELVCAVNLLLAATDSGCQRIVLPASLEEPIGNATPTSPYAAAKAATRMYASMFHTLYKTPVRLARVYMAYGPGQASTKVVPELIRSLLQGNSPTLKSPQRLLDWIYIDDVVEGLLAVAAKEGLDGLSLELGSGQLVSIEDLAGRLQDLLNRPRPMHVAPDEPRHDEIARCADLGATKRLIGWQPRVSLEDGLQRTIDAFRRQP